METFVPILHIVIALILIMLVLVQDSKSGSLGGAFGGGGSNSILGATGGATLAQKATRIAAGIFAITCISLSVMSSRSNKSVVDGMAPDVSTPTSAPTSVPTNAAAPGTSSEKSEASPKNNQ